MTEAGAKRARRIFLLQGPAGPFFAELQAELIAAGHHTIRATFDGGDRLFAGDGPRIRFDGNPAEIRAWLSVAIEAHAIDTIVLFGDERPIHRAARAEADARGLDTLCLEEGYIRPGYITAEWRGTNHNSPLIGTLAQREDAVPAVAPRPAPVPAGMGPIIRAAIVHYGGRILASRPGEWALFHRLRRPVAEILHSGPINLLMKLAHTQGDRRMLRRLRGNLHGRYDLVALQVPHDASLVVGGGGWNSPRLIQAVIDSFASAAPNDRHLVFKIHPMARGYLAEAAEIRRRARLRGVEGRVHCIRTGPLRPSLRSCRGFVTISSTSALSALLHGKVTVVLGQTIAGSNGLTLEESECPRPFPTRFWTAEERPPATAVARLLAYIRADALLPGDFYHPAGRRIAARQCTAKLGSLFPISRPGSVGLNEVEVPPQAA